MTLQKYYVVIEKQRGKKEELTVKVRNIPAPSNVSAWYLSDDVDAYLESIGAGGVSSTPIIKTKPKEGASLDEARAEFEAWAINKVEDWGIRKQEAFKKWHLGYYHQKVWFAWEAWKAARGVTELTKSILS